MTDIYILTEKYLIVIDPTSILIFNFTTGKESFLPVHTIRLQALYMNLFRFRYQIRFSSVLNYCEVHIHKLFLKYIHI